MNDLNANNKKYNFYAVLNCKENASYEEIKQSYQTLIKKYHPDKKRVENISNINSQEKLLSNDSEDFINIDRAWKTLRDEELRKQYDAELLENKLSNCPLIYAELKKAELNFSDKNEIFYPCRCGDNFIITEEYLKEEECIIECCQCSNYILIK